MKNMKFADGATGGRSGGNLPMEKCPSKRVGKSLSIMLGACAFAVLAHAQSAIEGFEYSDNAALQAAWTPQSAALTLSPNHSPKSTGTTSLRVDRSFPANTTETEILTGPVLPTPIAISSTQYLSFRFAGSSPSTNASWQKLYLYAFDGAGNFGRWSAIVPKTTTWQVSSFPASRIEKPAESPALPDLSNIAQFKFYLTGQGPTGGVASATMYIDDLGFLQAPVLSVVRQGSGQQVLMQNLIPGMAYTLQQTTNLTSPVTVKYSFSANSSSQTWPVPKGQQAFYSLYFAP